MSTNIKITIDSSIPKPVQNLHYGDVISVTKDDVKGDNTKYYIIAQVGPAVLALFTIMDDPVNLFNRTCAPADLEDHNMNFTDVNTHSIRKLFPSVFGYSDTIINVEKVDCDISFHIKK